MAMLVPPLIENNKLVPACTIHEQQPRECQLFPSPDTELYVLSPSFSERLLIYNIRLPVEIIVTIIEVSDWQSLSLWRATCRSLFTVVGILLRRRYDSYLKPFTSDVSAFDELLDRHRGIISGSTALHFFVPDLDWIPRELDVYVPANTYKPFVRALADTNGLGWTRIPIRKRKRARPILPSSISSLADEDSLDEYQSDENIMCDELPPPRRERVARDDSIFDEAPHIKHLDDNDTDDDTYPDTNQDDHVVSYIQMEHYNRYRPVMIHGTGYRAIRSFRTTTGRRVNVVGSHTNTPITPLRSFWATISMNFLTPRGAVCGFPSTTPRRVGALKRGKLTDRESHSCSIYQKRGFTFESADAGEALGFWDVLFFGELQVLVADFRTQYDQPRCPLPIKRTIRGWLPDETWRVTTKASVRVLVPVTLSDHTSNSRLPPRPKVRIQTLTYCIDNP